MNTSPPSLHTSAPSCTLMLTLSSVAFSILWLKAFAGHSVPFRNVLIPKKLLSHVHRSKNIFNTQILHIVPFQLRHFYSFIFCLWPSLPFLFIKAGNLETNRKVKSGRCYAWLRVGTQKLGMEASAERNKGRKKYMDREHNNKAAFTKCPLTSPWSVLWTECLCPPHPNAYMEALILIVCGDGAVGK